MAFMAVGLFSSAGMAALAVDISYFYLLKVQLQTSADVAALAAVRELSDEDAMRTTAVAYAAKNMPTSEHGNVLANADVVMGNWDAGTGTFTAAGTPANAVQVVEALPERRIVFVPDNLMGRNLQRETDKEIIPWHGTCIVHETFSPDSLAAHRHHYPDTEILVHTESRIRHDATPPLDAPGVSGAARQSPGRQREYEDEG